MKWQQSKNYILLAIVLFCIATESCFIFILLYDIKIIDSLQAIIWNTIYSIRVNIVLCLQ